MGLPSGTFSRSFDGTLVVNFSMRALVESAEYAGQADRVVLRAYVGSGAGRLQALLDSGHATATLCYPYTADEEVPVGLEEVDDVFDAAEDIAADLLAVTCRLFPPAVAGGTEQPPITFDGLIRYLKAQLQPMSGTVQVPRWEPDIVGADWFVRPLADLATVEVTRTGFTGPLGGAAFDDEFLRQIDPASITAYSVPPSGSPQVPMTATVTSSGYHVDLKNGVPNGAWSATYRCVGTPGDGTTYETAWAGFAPITATEWAAMSPGDQLWVCGTHQDSTLEVLASGADGAYLKIRLDHPTDPGKIYAGRIVQNTEWVVAPNGEFYLEPATAPNNMLFEDARRLRGMSITSRATCNVLNVDLGADTLLVSSLRPIETGTKVYITGNINLLRIPAPLERQVPYYAILISGPPFSLGLQLKQYTIKLAASPEDAVAGTAIDLTVAGDGGSWYIWHQATAWPFLDPVPGALQPGEFGYDAENARLYYKPSSGTPADHSIRWSRDQGALDGACIYIEGYSYIKILGGGEYGGLFGVPPVGECAFAHLIPIVARNGTDVLVDGVNIYSCRHGVGHRELARMTVRNCRVRDVGWHALGSDQVAQVTGCPDLLVERNWCSEIGLLHDWGDVQGIITTPKCHRAVFRRNLIQRNGRNEPIINTGTLIADSSEDMVFYLNWSDDFSGVGIVTAPGPDGPIPGFRAVCNIFTRGSFRLGNYPAGPVHGRVGAFALVNQNTDVNDVSDLRAFGNIVAFSSVPYTATYAPTEHLGHVHIRTAAGATVEVTQFERNAFLQTPGLIYCIQRNVGTAPFGTIVGDNNLYAGLTMFHEQWSVTTQVAAFDASHIVGPAPDYWSGVTGNDANSIVTTATDSFSGPTSEQLEILRLYDEYDTFDIPTVAIVGNFPLIPA